LRLWTVVLFVIGINIGFSVLNAANIWCSWGDYSNIRVDQGGPHPYLCNQSLYGTSITLDEKLSPGYSASGGASPNGSIKTSDIGWGILNGIPVIGQIAAVIQYVLSFEKFIGLFTGIFTSIGELMTNIGFPVWIAWGIQFSMNIVIFYGLLQFILGRSGKTVE
jgi:hypothetical protein